MVLTKTDVLKCPVMRLFTKIKHKIFYSSMSNKVYYSYCPSSWYTIQHLYFMLTARRCGQHKIHLSSYHHNISLGKSLGGFANFFAGYPGIQPSVKYFAQKQTLLSYLGTDWALFVCLHPNKIYQLFFKATVDHNIMTPYFKGFGTHLKFPESYIYWFITIFLQ